MIGETNLDILLKTMNPVLHDGEYVFCTLQPEQVKNLHPDPVLWFSEEEGITVILPRAQADRAGLPYTYLSRMITLSVKSSLYAVGFLAAVTSKLAEHGISINPVSAYYHDHLFVPTKKSHEAMGC